jgi:hypothetical protein
VIEIHVMQPQKKSEVNVVLEKKHISRNGNFMQAV